MKTHGNKAFKLLIGGLVMFFMGLSADDHTITAGGIVLLNLAWAERN